MKNSVKDTGKQIEERREALHDETNGPGQMIYIETHGTLGHHVPRLGVLRWIGYINDNINCNEVPHACKSTLCNYSDDSLVRR
jgi:hypothetical protein